jgi:VanZ family protein
MLSLPPCSFPIFPVLNFLQQLLLTSSFARLRYWSAMAMFLLILIAGSIPGARADVGQLASGIVLHSCAYAVLTFLVFTGSTGGLAQRASKAVLTIAAMGAVDELVQSFLPYRHGAASDWMVDCSAALVTASLMWVLWATRKVRA